jgi:diaminopimelate decarboxylase
MPLLRDAQGHATLGGLRLADLAARFDVRTPFYAYDVDGIVERAKALATGYGDHPHHISYAVKANTAGRIVRRLAAAGVGADVVSGGELAVALGSGISPDSIVFSGVAKSNDELDAALHAGSRGILAIVAESVEELARIEARAKTAGRPARMSLRVKPGVVVDTHANIATGHDEAKFGIARGDVAEALARAVKSPQLSLQGLSMHIGSQMTDTDDYDRAGAVLCELAKAFRSTGGSLSYLDFGGGFGIDYGDGCPVSPADFARRTVDMVRAHGLDDLRLLCEPGRSLVAPEGVLVARVIQLKAGRASSSSSDNQPDGGWLFVDAGMNDLMRPALYQARHRIEPLVTPPGSLSENGQKAIRRVCGPVCESSDDFGSYEFPADFQAPALVVIRDAGAYGFTMASQYNGRALPDEVFLENGRVAHVSRPATVDSWVRDRLAT